MRLDLFREITLVMLRLGNIPGNDQPPSIFFCDVDRQVDTLNLFHPSQISQGGVWLNPSCPLVSFQGHAVVNNVETTVGLPAAYQVRAATRKTQRPARQQAPESHAPGRDPALVTHDFGDVPEQQGR